MNPPGSIRFKVATEEAELEQIHRLNYATFVEEIPQHSPRPDGRLVDQYHDDNTYVIGLDGEEVVGMLALRGNRPFSLDQKLTDLDDHLPKDRRVCELRLLSIKHGNRKRRVLPGLISVAAEEALDGGYDLAIISGLLRQQRLYSRLGFIPFGPTVGTPDAPYQPMFLTLEAFRKARNGRVRSLTMSARTNPLSFLPGPVEVHPDVERAFAAPAVSHRSHDFVTVFQEVEGLLRDLVSARDACVMLGSGTLANDAVAAQLSLLDRPGLVLSNGEFGRRLIDHAARAGLGFDTLEVAWGETFDMNDVIDAIRATPGLGWVWATHCETSTGVLNPVSELEGECAARGVRLCLDCISSVGAVPVDLSNVYLASGSSGKALAAYPGLAMVYSDHDLVPAALPRYLDVGHYASTPGPPFTQSSNLVLALGAALRRQSGSEHHAKLSCLSTWFRRRLDALGFVVVAPEEFAAPCIVTIELPKRVESDWIATRLSEAGCLVYFESDYLRRNNWIQISLMGLCSEEKLNLLLDELVRFAPGGSGEDTGLHSFLR